MIRAALLDGGREAADSLSGSVQDTNGLATALGIRSEQSLQMASAAPTRSRKGIDMPSRMPVVFISATSADLRSYRTTARDQMLTCRIYPDVQESFAVYGGTIQDKLRGAIAQCDAVICLVGECFGEPTPDDPETSYTQMEYWTARQLEKPVYLFTTHEDCELDSRPAEEAAKRERQQRFRQQLFESGYECQAFRNHEELRAYLGPVAGAIKELATATPAPTAGTNVMPGIRELPGLDPATPLKDALERLLAISLAPLISWLTRPMSGDAGGPPTELRGISRDYWQNASLFAGQLVTISGSLSRYAPMMVGPSYVKRNLHREYRAHDIDPREAEIDASLIDAKLGFSAGQLVWRLDLDALDYEYLGLYRSIVRNSVPVYIHKDTYEKQVTPHLERTRSAVVEVEITGRLGPIMPFEETLKTMGATKTLNAIAEGEGCIDGFRLQDAFGIFIDEHADPQTGVRVAGPGRYLDGDIWSAVSRSTKDGRHDHLLNMPGLNLSDPVDFGEHFTLLQKRIRQDHADDEVLFEFDQVRRPCPHCEQALSTFEVIKSLGLLDELVAGG